MTENDKNVLTGDHATCVLFEDIYNSMPQVRLITHIIKHT